MLAGYACAFAYVLLRAGSDAVPNQASPPGLARLAWLLSGGNYRAWFLTQYDPVARAGHVLGLIVRELSPAGFGLALLAWPRSRARSARVALGIGLAVVGNVAFFFRYRVDDLEVFLLPSVALLCAVRGARDSSARGQARGARADATASRRSRPSCCSRSQASASSSGYAQHDLSRFDAAERYAQRLAVSLPRGAVIVHYATPAEWKYHAVFGLYFQHVLQVRRDVIVVANLDRALLDRLLREGRPVYLYARVEHVSREYALAPEGDLFRLLYRF